MYVKSFRRLHQKKATNQSEPYDTAKITSVWSKSWGFGFAPDWLSLSGLRFASRSKSEDRETKAMFIPETRSFLQVLIGWRQLIQHSPKFKIVLTFLKQST